MLIYRKDEGAFVLLFCERHTSPSEGDVDGLDFLHVYDSQVPARVGDSQMPKAVTIWVMRPVDQQLLMESS